MTVALRPRAGASRRARFAIAALGLLAFAGPLAAAAPVDPDLDRLSIEVASLDADPALAELAPFERLKARQALARLQQARSRQRDDALALARRRVEAAVAAANAELLEQQSVQLDRERDQIMVEASRREAERARRESDLMRLQTLAREEEAERLAETNSLESEASAAQVEAANAEADQAKRLAAARSHEVELARKEADLAAQVAAGSGPAAEPAPAVVGDAPLPPSKRVGGRTVYLLAGDAYPSGSAQLTPRALASLRTLAAAVPAGHDVRIDAYTDSQGEANDNRNLSQRRADAVRRALAAAGIPAQQLDAVGHGELAPVADNTTEAGRARNRRVEIAIQ